MCSWAVQHMETYAFLMTGQRGSLPDQMENVCHVTLSAQCRRTNRPVVDRYCDNNTYSCFLSFTLHCKNVKKHLHHVQYVLLDCVFC